MLQARVLGPSTEQKLLIDYKHAYDQPLFPNFRVNDAICQRFFATEAKTPIASM